jgi:hypothetical protein
VKRCWPFLMMTATALATICSTATSSIFCPRTRPCYQPGVPDRDYQFGPRSGTAESISSVLLELPPVPGQKVPGERLRYYQLGEPRLQLEFCQVTRVAVTLRDSGEWIVSLRGEQNQSVPTLPNSVQPKSNIDFALRNKFRIRVLCYGNFPVTEKLLDKSTGKPVLAQLEAEPFWVQRGVPRDVRMQYWSNDVKSYFDRIDRVLVVFSYE